MKVISERWLLFVENRLSIALEHASKGLYQNDHHIEMIAREDGGSQGRKRRHVAEHLIDIHVGKNPINCVRSPFPSRALLQQCSSL